MIGELQRFAKHSAVYLVGNMIYRGASFILVPLYAHMLTPAEYGMLEILTVTAAIFQSLFASGVAHTALRFYFEYDQPRDRHAVMSTALLASFAITSVGVTALWFLAPLLSQTLLSSSAYTIAFRLAFVSLVFEISRELSLALVRAREQSVFFVVMAVAQLVVQVSANLVTVVYLRMGAVGILTGNLIAIFVVWSILTVNTVRAVGLRFEWAKLTAVVKYAFPLMLSSISATLLSSADRYLLRIYQSLAATGVYALAQRLAQVIPVLIVDPFQKSFGPFRFSVMKQPNAQAIYARVLTVYVLVSSGVVLGLTVFGPEIVRLVASAPFGAAAGVLPLVLAPAALSGVTYVFQTGIYIQKATTRILYSGIVAGLVSLAANVVLIPRFGVGGAGAASLLGAVVSAVLTYILAQRLYPVAFQLRSDALIVAVMLAGGLLAHLVPADPWILRIALKGAVVGTALIVAAAVAGVRVHTVRAFVNELRSRARDARRATRPAEAPPRSPLSAEAGTPS